MTPPIKMRLKAKNQIPYGGGYKILDPLTGIRIEAVTWDHLMTKVRDERRANGAPLGLELEDEVEQWACIAHPDEVDVVDERLPKRRSFGLDDIVRGTRTILSFLASGKVLVSQEEAERRAEICCKCPLNIGYSMSCSVCDKLSDIVQGIIGPVRTTHDQQLLSCGVCQCSLKAAVHVPLDVLNQANTAEMNQAFAVMQETYKCWHNS